MFDRSNSLLPPTATDLSRALDILEERLFELPVQMITKDPQLVDPGLLDHLAWEHSVDVWDPDWTDDIKRAVIAVSVEVHRFKGTPHAIKTALGAFDVDTELLEWWQPDGVADAMEPGSFRVTAYAGRSLYGDNENSINNAMLHALNAVVQRVAPVSRKLIFRLGERFDSTCMVQSAARLAYRCDAVLDPGPEPLAVDQNIALQTASQVTCRSGIVHDPTPVATVAVISMGLRTAAMARVINQETYHIQGRFAG